MPRLFLAHTVSGVGYTGVNVDDGLVGAPPSGTPAWYKVSGDPAKVICNAKVYVGDSRPDRLLLFNPAFSNFIPFWEDEEGATRIYSGAGVILTDLVSDPTKTRLQNDHDKTTLNGVIPWDVDVITGTAVVVESGGKHLQLIPRAQWTPDVTIPLQGPVYSARSLSGFVCWCEGRETGVRPFAYDLTSKQNIALKAAKGNVYQAKLTVRNNIGYLLYSMEDGTVYFHQALNTTKGHTLPAGPHYGLDSEYQPDGQLLVAWSTDPNQIAGTQHTVLWSFDVLEALSITADDPSGGGTPGAPPSGTPAPPGGTIPPPGPGSSDDPGGTDGAGSTTDASVGVTLYSSATFDVAGAAEELVTLPIEVWPAYPAEGGYGRIVHPILGAFDYEVKPDEWVNIDANAIIQPVWASTRTLTSAANVLWQGNIRDVVIEERWKALGGLAMPVTQFRMLLAIWTMPVDPDVSYVHWYPSYITRMGFKVLPVMLTSGSGSGITFDDVVNYKDDDGNPIGWMTNPVTFTLKLVAKL